MPTKKTAKKPSYRITPPRPRPVSATRSVDTIGSQRTRSYINSELAKYLSGKKELTQVRGTNKAIGADMKLSAANGPRYSNRRTAIGSATRSVDTIGARRTRSMLNADKRMGQRIGTNWDDHLKQYGAWVKADALNAEIKRSASSKIQAADAKRAEIAKKKAAGPKIAAKKQKYR